MKQFEEKEGLLPLVKSKGPLDAAPLVILDRKVGDPYTAPKRDTPIGPRATREDDKSWCA